MSDDLINEVSNWSDSEMQNHMSIEEKLKIIKERKFNCVGYSYIAGEDTFIFDTDSEASRAFKALNKDISGWWYGRDEFHKMRIKYERDNGEPLITTWITRKDKK